MKKKLTWVKNYYQNTSQEWETPKSIQYFEGFLVKFWWVIIFMILCYWIYERAEKKLQLEYSSLHARLIELQLEKLDAVALQENLQLQINSQSDQDWVELTLMKGLGVIPEGYQKVYFKH